MQWPRIMLGIVLDLMGTIWLLQGLNVLAGSPMTGVPFWAGAGVVLMIIGNLVLFWTVRSAGRGPTI